MNSTGFADVNGAALTSDSATPLCAIGSIVPDSRGRLYRYVLAGVAPLVPGNLIQSPAQVTAHQQLVPTVTQPVGSKQIVVTLGAAAAAENLYAEGLAVIDTTPGEGYGYAISGHAAVLSGGVATITLRNDDPIQIALAAGSRVTLVPHFCRGVIQTPVTTLTGVPVGVAVYPVAAGRYGWVGCLGDFPTLMDGAPGVGMALSAPGAAPGAAAINSTTLPIIGHALMTGVTGKIFPAKINLL